MPDHDIAARLDAVLGVSRPMLVHPSDHELVEALLRRIETVEPRAVRLTETVLDEAKHKIQQDAAADLFRVLARPERAIPGNPRAIAGQSSGRSGRWVDTGTNLVWREGAAPAVSCWIPVGDRLPTEDDLDDYGDVLVAVLPRAGGEPWTDRAFMHADGRWRWARDQKALMPGIHITHWMPVPLPPGAEGSGVGEEGCIDA